MNVDDTGVALPDARSCRVLVRLPGPTFVPGRYRINTFVGVPFLQHVDEISGALTFEVGPPAAPWRPYELYTGRGSSAARRSGPAFSRPPPLCGGT